ncbi:TPA: DUF3884 family protein [Bacillus cereus]|uniref:DUF3884 family protein n=1 Tax=Bacillus TaxID=1386 RepID=UPI000863F4C6|nr:MULTISPECIES: DUF3884 family protein [Bacillus]MCP1180490.1 DUF3884 family protein [Bacillus sp. 1663tsa1]MCP1285479.1 DUF3884 family protein [Bacillus sp. S0635]MCQ6349478.1 DUF3884 family protein [Bacillus cereus]MCU5751671.1 DUF3884 family protein [Bacillus cereus]SCM91087.1 Uncharacterized protein BCF24048_00520 [Bacillus cereus]
MKHSNDLKGIGEKLNPTIYQIRFMKLGDWLSTSAQMWACHSTMYKYNREEFEKEFLEITKLTADNVLISTGGIGLNFMSPGWRNSL